MIEWQNRPLGQVLRLQRGHDLTEAQRKPGIIPVIGSAGQNGWHKVARSGGPGVTIGRSGASIGVVTYVDQPYWPHNTVLYVTDFLGNDPRFLYYMLKTIPLSELNSGAAQPSLNRNFVYPVEVSLPPPNMQHEIGTMLRAYDDLIEVNRCRIATLESMARGLFEEWFVRFHFPGHEAVAITATDDTALPSGWRAATIGEVARIAGRSIDPASTPNATYAHFSLPAFDDGCWPAFECGGAIRSNKLAFDEPVVLVAKLNPRIPRVWPVLEAHDALHIASTEFVPLAPTAPFTLGLLYAYVGHPSFLGRLSAMVGGTSTSHQRVKPADILNAPVALPPLGVLEAANRHFDPLLRHLLTLRAANRKLAAARDLLLPRLLSGRLTLRAAERELAEAA